MIVAGVPLASCCEPSELIIAPRRLPPGRRHLLHTPLLREAVLVDRAGCLQRAWRGYGEVPHSAVRVRRSAPGDRERTWSCVCSTERKHSLKASIKPPSIRPFPIGLLSLSFLWGGAFFPFWATKIVVTLKPLTRAPTHTPDNRLKLVIYSFHSYFSRICCCTCTCSKEWVPTRLSTHEAAGTWQAILPG